MAFRACYNPSREVVANQLPCLPDADQSFCCEAGLVCGTNSLCYKSKDANITDGEPFIFRGSCTDPTWNSPECSTYCRGGLYGQYEKDNTVGIYQCHADIFECSVDEFGVEPCLYNATIFPLPSFQNITTIGGDVGPAYSTAFSSSSTSSASSVTTTSLTSGASSSMTTSASSATSATSSTSSSAAPSTSSAAPSPTTAQPANSSTLSTGAKAGIGVGVAVGVLAVIAILVLLYYCLRQRKETAELRQHVAGLYERQSSAKFYKRGQQEQELESYMPLHTYQKMEPVEMDGSRQLRELPTGHRSITEPQAALIKSELNMPR